MYRKSLVEYLPKGKSCESIKSSKSCPFFDRSDLRTRTMRRQDSQDFMDEQDFVCTGRCAQVTSLRSMAFQQNPWPNAGDVHGVHQVHSVHGGRPPACVATKMIQPLDI